MLWWWALQPLGWTSAWRLLKLLTRHDPASGLEVETGDQQLQVLRGRCWYLNLPHLDQACFRPANVPDVPGTAFRLRVQRMCGSRTQKAISVLALRRCGPESLPGADGLMPGTARKAKGGPPWAI